jgi:DMSO/TMAO reductase YedYZ heme-binding membrane subunit
MTQQRRTPIFVVAIAWLAVSLPALWGVYHTALNALKLFQDPITHHDAKEGPSSSK